jgi:hypothetical protein
MITLKLSGVTGKVSGSDLSGVQLSPRLCNFFPESGNYLPNKMDLAYSPPYSLNLRFPKCVKWLGAKHG